jgi:hypothetical protein
VHSDRRNGCNIEAMPKNREVESEEENSVDRSTKVAREKIA